MWQKSSLAWTQSLKQLEKNKFRRFAFDSSESWVSLLWVRTGMDEEHLLSYLTAFQNCLELDGLSLWKYAVFADWSSLTTLFLLFEHGISLTHWSDDSLLSHGRFWRLGEKTFLGIHSSIFSRNFLRQFNHEELISLLKSSSQFVSLIRNSARVKSAYE